MQEAGVSTDGNAEVWWSGGCSACRKLESAQMGMQKCGGQEGVVHAGSWSQHRWECRSVVVRRM